MKFAYKPLLGLAICCSVVGCSPEGADSSVPASANAPAAGNNAKPNGNTSLARTDQPGATNTGAAAVNRVASPAATPATASTPAAPPSPPKPIAPGSLYTGVYTAAQAARGKAIQTRDCSACHNPDDWGQGAVLGHYTGATAYNLVEYVKNNMPFDEPGRLSYQEYVDVVAFLFQVNEVPTGTKELPTDPAKLGAIKLEYRRP